MPVLTSRSLLAASRVASSASRSQTRSLLTSAGGRATSSLGGKTLMSSPTSAKVLVPCTSAGTHLPSSYASFHASSRAREEEATASPPDLYNFTEEEVMLQESVRKFAEEVVGPKVYAMDEAELMDPAVIQGMFDQGLMGIETPVEYDGAGMSFMSAILAVEELAKVDPSVSVCCDVHNTLVNSTIRLHANEDIKKRFLPRLATDTLGSFCLSEPVSGSDAFALQTTAKLDASGDFYTLNGSKMWITNSGEAGIFVVFANVDPSKGYKGITCFVLDKEMGVTIAKKEKKLGIKASSTCLLNFDDVKIPKENVIGEVGKGYKIAIDVLNEGRIGIAAQMIGLASGAFAKSVNYAYQRKQFGKPIGDFQGMGFQFAQVHTEIEAARLLTYNAARLKEAGKPFTKEAAMAKLYASQVAQKASGFAVEWAGGVGFTREVGLEKFWRDSMIGAIYEGTSNIQLETIAKFIKKEYS